MKTLRSNPLVIRRFCQAKNVSTGMKFNMAGHTYQVRYVLPRSLRIMIYARDLSFNENVGIFIDPLSVLEVTYLKK